MARVIVVLLVISCIVGSSVALPAKRGFVDALTNMGVTALSKVGSFLLPDESMKGGCKAVDLCNIPAKCTEEVGGLQDVAAKSLGSGLAQFGNAIFARKDMISGCISAGYYDPNPKQVAPQIRVPGGPVLTYGPNGQPIYVYPGQPNGLTFAPLPQPQPFPIVVPRPSVSVAPPKSPSGVHYYEVSTSG